METVEEMQDTHEIGREEADRPVSEYNAAVDQNLVNFVQGVRSGYFKQPNARNYSLGEVSERAARDISTLVGVNVDGYKHNIKGSAIEHIENRHGTNGTADRSMANIEDIGRIGYVLNNYDSVNILRNRDGTKVLSKGSLNSSGTPSPMIRYEKRVNGTFYLVEAVPETKTKTLQVISAYKTKTGKEGGQMPDAVHTPRPNVQNESAATSK